MRSDLPVRPHEAGDPAGWSRPPSWLQPSFSGPGVRALMSDRQGGVSGGAFGSFNPRPGIGDDERAVSINRERLRLAAGRPPLLFQQVHGTAVAVLDELPAGVDSLSIAADAVVSSGTAHACEIQVADCLPVLFAHRDGRVVGAAHAGWRGLAGGVLEATLEALGRLGGDAAPDAFEAWLGPCIGPAAFEVGEDVREAFCRPDPGAAPHFVAGPGPGKWLADLPALARRRLRAAGVLELAGNDGSDRWCTVSQPERYFSYRRDRHCGRMSALIWREPEAPVGSGAGLG